MISGTERFAWFTAFTSVIAIILLTQTHLFYLGVVFWLAPIMILMYKIVSERLKLNPGWPYISN